MVSTTQDLMNPYPVPEESSVKLISQNVVKDQLQHSEPSQIQINIPSQASAHEESTQESTQNETQEPAKIEAVGSQRQSLSSQSSITSVSSASTNLNDSDETQSQLYVTELIKRAKSHLEDHNAGSEESRSVVSELLNSLVKARAEAGQYKIKAQLLSISSKDADMRYEVENELIKRQVERLKAQGQSMESLISKLNHQKLTLKKYKNEIINKNKEIIRLRSKQSEGKRRKKSDSTHSGMLDTLGLLASQVLTQEEKNRDTQESSSSYALPKLNSFKHNNNSQQNGNSNAPNETTISEYSVN